MGGRRIGPARPRFTRGRSRAGQPAGYVVDQVTQHWRRIGDRWYRDAVVILPDGTRRLWSFPDEESAA